MILPMNLGAGSLPLFCLSSSFIIVFRSSMRVSSCLIQGRGRGVYPFPWPGFYFFFAAVFFEASGTKVSSGAIGSLLPVAGL
jgi:hypothetical protein